MTKANGLDQSQYDPLEFTASVLADIYEVSISDFESVDKETEDKMGDILDTVDPAYQERVFIMFLKELDRRGIEYEMKDFVGDVH